MVFCIGLPGDTALSAGLGVDNLYQTHIQISHTHYHAGCKNKMN